MFTLNHNISMTERIPKLKPYLPFPIVFTFKTNTLIDLSYCGFICVRTKSISLLSSRKGQWLDILSNV